MELSNKLQIIKEVTSAMSATIKHLEWEINYYKNVDSSLQPDGKLISSQLEMIKHDIQEKFECFWISEIIENLDIPF